MEFFKTLTLPEVLKELTSASHDDFVEEVPLLESLGRIAATDFIAEFDMPMFDRSTVDGYAIKSKESLGASESIPSFFTLVGESKMGESIDQTLNSGEAIYVPTGGMLPPGADAMVMIEYTEKMDEQTLLVYKPSPPGADISYRGDDLSEGDLVVKSGRKIDAYDIGMLSGAGFEYVSVFKPLKVTVISTGDEVKDLNEKLNFGQIYDVNGYTVSARLKELGCQVVSKVLVKDNYDALKAEVARGLEISDLVLLSGGSSVGTRDFTSKVIESFDESQMITHGVAIKPGKPTIVGRVGKKFVIGLPGHPASALIIFNAIVQPLILNYANRTFEAFKIKATLLENVHAAPGKDTFQMVHLNREGDEWTCMPIYAKSGMMSLLANASGYIHISNEKEGLLKGSIVEVSLLQEVRI